MNKWILLVTLLFGALANAGQLSVLVGPSPATVLPVSLNSCMEIDSSTTDLSAPTFAFTKFKLSWTGSETLKVGLIQVDLAGPELSGQKYQCIIAGNELEAVLLGHSQMTDGNFYSSCGIRCGGLSFLPQFQSAEVRGSVKVIGTEISANGNARLIEETVPVSVQYTRP